MALPPEVCTFRPCSGSLVVAPYILYRIVVSNLAVLSFPWILRPADLTANFYLGRLLRRSFRQKNPYRRECWPNGSFLRSCLEGFFCQNRETLFRDNYNYPPNHAPTISSVGRCGKHDTRQPHLQWSFGILWHCIVP